MLMTDSNVLPYVHVERPGIRLRCSYFYIRFTELLWIGHTYDAFIYLSRLPHDGNAHFIRPVAAGGFFYTFEIEGWRREIGDGNVWDID